MSDNRLESFGFVRSIEPKSRRVTVVVSTNRVARDGAIVESTGWDLANYEKNPVVLWAHNDREMPIARTVKSTITASELIQVHEFDSDPAAEVVWSKVARGFINATSVRWIPGEITKRRVDGREIVVFTKGHQLLEVSYVSVPADADALVLRADGTPFRIADYAAPASAPFASAVNWAKVADAIERETKKHQAERTLRQLGEAIAQGVKDWRASTPLTHMYRIVSEAEVDGRRASAMHAEARAVGDALGIRPPRLEYFVRVRDPKLATFSVANDIAGVAPARRVLINVGDGQSYRELAHVVAHELAHVAEKPGMSPVESERAAEDFARRRCRQSTWGGPCRQCSMVASTDRFPFRWHA